jgi:hypothetical protein
MAHFSPMSSAAVRRRSVLCSSGFPELLHLLLYVLHLEALDAVDVEALVEHTVLDDAVTLLGGHRARAEGVPGGLDVALLRRTDVS